MSLPKLVCERYLLSSTIKPGRITKIVSDCFLKGDFIDFLTNHNPFNPGEK
jgi:hypothetical protein